VYYRRLVHREELRLFLFDPPFPILQSYIVAMSAARGGDTTSHSESLSDSATSSEQSARARSQQKIDIEDAINYFLEISRMEQQENLEKRFKLVLQSTNSDQHCLWNALREAMIDAGMPALEYIQIRKEILNSDSDENILLQTYKKVGPTKQMESSEVNSGARA
jgi:hypothetical protein